MGKLLKFDRRPRVKNGGENIPGDAQILMFTGVRYERGTSLPTDARHDPTRSKRKRG